MTAFRPGASPPPVLIARRSRSVMGSTLSRGGGGGQRGGRRPPRVRRRIAGLVARRDLRRRRPRRLVPLELDLEPERDRPDAVAPALRRPRPGVFGLELEEEPAPVEVAAEPRVEPRVVHVHGGARRAEDREAEL